jgi:integrase
MKAVSGALRNWREPSSPGYTGVQSAGILQQRRMICAGACTEGLRHESWKLIHGPRARRRGGVLYEPPSGHSLRAGFATSATRAGVSTFKIRQQTGHASDTMLSGYVRDGELFLGNAAGILL